MESRFRVEGLWFRVQGLRFTVQGSGFGLQGLGFGVMDDTATNPFDQLGPRCIFGEKGRLEFAGGHRGVVAPPREHLLDGGSRSGFWVLGFGVWDLGFGFWVLGFWFWGSGFGVHGLGLRV